MFPYTSINPELRNDVLATQLFDSYRIVDIKSHEVCEYGKNDAEPRHTGDTCHHIWSRKRPCINCTSYSCIANKKEIVKIEQLGGQALLIFSVPVKIKERYYALELIKDVTDSLMVPTENDQSNIALMDMVRRFNDLAVHDPFTGLYNKPYIENKLQVMSDELEDVEADSAELPRLVLLDIDYFKQVNDRYGHVSGDEVLKWVADQVAAVADKFDDAWAGRFGGDEFVLGLPAGAAEAGEEALAELEEAVRRKNFELDGQNASVSISYGATRILPNDTSAQIIERADKAMYKMKEVNHALWPR